MFRLPRKNDDARETTDLNGNALGDETQDAPEGDRLPRYRRCCRRIHRAYMALHEGRIDPETYRIKKENLLRRAVRDAKKAEAGPELVRMMETLRLATAVNDVELESVRTFFR